MQFKVGQQITIPADDILGCEAELVEVVEIYKTSMLVRQLTNVNGEPGDFEVDFELNTLFGNC